MQDALKVSNAISRVAEIDGFTFKIKNFDSSNSSLYLPQTPKDQELTKETYNNLREQAKVKINELVRFHQPQEDVDTIRGMI